MATIFCFNEKTFSRHMLLNKIIETLSVTSFDISSLLFVSRLEATITIP